MSSSQSLVCEINRGNGELKIKPKCKKLATLIQETNTRRMHPVLGKHIDRFLRLKHFNVCILFTNSISP